MTLGGPEARHRDGEAIARKGTAYGDTSRSICQSKRNRSHGLYGNERSDSRGKTLACLTSHIHAVLSQGVKNCFDEAVRAALSKPKAKMKKSGLGGGWGSTKQLPEFIAPVMPPAGKAPWTQVMTSTFGADWGNVLQSGAGYADVEFECADGTGFRAHKAVLVSASTLFRKVFEEELLPAFDPTAQAPETGPKSPMCTLFESLSIDIGLAASFDREQVGIDCLVDLTDAELQKYVSLATFFIVFLVHNGFAFIFVSPLLSLLLA
jgi:hypothetical protein